MFPWNKYPYTDFHELNDSWILATLKELINQVENFVSINAIKYADPIQWDITRQYEKNTIVMDPQTGTAYISVAPVPIGVQLNRPEYWTVVFDLGSFVTKAAKNFTSRYEEDTTTTATFNTNAGEWLVWGDELYVANVNITAGDTYVVNSNVTRITVEAVKNDILSMIGDLDDLDTTDKSNLVAAINEVLSARPEYVISPADFGGVGDGVTDDTQAITDALAECQTTKKPFYVEPDKNYLYTSPIVISSLAHDIIIKGQLTYDGSGEAFTIESAQLKKIELAITGNDTSEGVVIKRLSQCVVNLREIMHFTTGLHLLATSGGIGYNTFTGYLGRCVEGVVFEIADNSSYINENLFVNLRILPQGGLTNSYGVHMKPTAYSYYYNNNIFIKCCVERNYFGWYLETARRNYIYNTRVELVTYPATCKSTATANYFLLDSSNDAEIDESPNLSNVFKHSLSEPFTLLYNLDHPQDYIFNNANDASLPPYVFRYASGNISGMMPSGTKRAEGVGGSTGVYWHRFDVRNLQNQVVGIKSITLNKSKYKIYIHMIDENDNEITTAPKANVTLSSVSTFSPLTVFQSDDVEHDTTARALLIPSTCKYLEIGIKNANNVYCGINLYNRDLIRNAILINVHSGGLDSIPTNDNTVCKIGDYCKNNNTSNPTLKGWFFNGSSWVADYINNTP